MLIYFESFMLVTLSQTFGWFSKLSVVEDVDFLSDSYVKEVLVHNNHFKNKILPKKNIN